MRSPVQHGTAAALKNAQNRSACQSVLSLSYQHVDCFVHERRNSDESDMPSGRGIRFDRSKQIGVVLVQEGVSGSYLPVSVDFLSQAFRFKRLRLFPVLLTQLESPKVSLDLKNDGRVHEDES